MKDQATISSKPEDAEEEVEQLKKLSADVAACSTSAEAELLLNELHERLFCCECSLEDSTAEVTQSRVRTLLRSTDFTSPESSAVTECSKVHKRKRPLISGNLVTLECVLLLAHVFLSTVCGRKTVSETVTHHQLKRLDTLVMPKLFMLTKVSARQLRDVALRRPWNFFVTHVERDTSSNEAIPPTVRDLLTSVKVNYHCDFLPVMGHAMPVTVPNNVQHHSGRLASSEVADCQSQIVGAQLPQQVKVAPRQKPLTSGSTYVCSKPLSTSSCGLPSYLISRGRGRLGAKPVDSAGVARNETMSEPHNSESPVPSRRPKSDSEDSNSILALETPVRRRRRVDPSLHVSPSPDMPHIEINQSE